MPEFPVQEAAKLLNRINHIGFSSEIELLNHKALMSFLSWNFWTKKTSEKCCVTPVNCRHEMVSVIDVVLMISGNLVSH